MNTEVIEQPTKVAQAITPMDMLQMAVSQGADLDKLEQLMGLHERWEASEARKAFVVAMNEFKREPPEILKSTNVAFGTTQYTHASLSDVVLAVCSGLSKHGLSHHWDTAQSEGQITVTCVITHEQGHSESTPLSAGADSSGGKNSIQAIGSTVTYLQRYTLLSATGLAAKGMDNDARTVEPISADQAANLRAMVDEVDADLPKLLKFAGAATIEEIPADRFAEVVRILELKRAGS